MHAQSSAASIRITSKPCRHRSRRPRDGGEGEDEENGDEPVNKMARGEETTSFNRLKLIGNALRDQFKDVESVFESNRASYEITTDCGFDAAAVSEDGTLLCHVVVEFDDEFGNNAEVTVECADAKLASHVRDCIRNVAAAAAPLQF
ncbi:Pre-mRNA 3'-end-processing endonuclease polyadenylation factor C-term [Fragilaria crotonensis]|nr:Pre-mRNA 3'-end-processing endonuclease polyadenylation factor C-term [Fragilaria crotonensis]